MGRGLAAMSCAAVLLAGGASTALNRYVGQDVTRIVERYGPPARQFTRPDGSKAFQWVFSGGRSAATSAPLSMFLPTATAPLDERRQAASSGLILGGMCVYTVAARWAPEHRSWDVVGFDRPRADCD